jgi:pre-mRNA-splicing factor CWC22
VPELDLVDLDDQITHELSLEDNHDIEKMLDVFRLDPDWDENESAYVHSQHRIA